MDASTSLPSSLPQGARAEGWSGQRGKTPPGLGELGGSCQEKKGSEGLGRGGRGDGGDELVVTERERTVPGLEEWGTAEVSPCSPCSPC